MSKLYIVGIGPGQINLMTKYAFDILTKVNNIVGYKTYIDLIKDEFNNKNYISTPMKKELDRCKIALDIAKNEDVAIICSGDAGVYGMSGPIYEVFYANKELYKEVEILVIPGVSAALSGAAILGAPLMHDFCVISLSDLLTPLPIIYKRLECAAMADFIITIYNPSSKKREDYLKNACKILRKYKRDDTICAVVKKIARDGETYKILTLKELENTETDMFCTVFIGNSTTMSIGNKMITKRGYDNKYEI